MKMRSILMTGAVAAVMVANLAWEPNAFAQDTASSSEGEVSNSIPVEVGGSDQDQMNVPYVSVKICAPGTQICQIIPHISLDTGSTGLRLQARAISKELSSALKVRKDSNGRDIGECMTLAQGDDWWGPITSADVILGNEIASNINIQIADPNFHKVPKSCAGDAEMVSDERNNGVLGLNFRATDCDTPNGKCLGADQANSYATIGFYACDGIGRCLPRTVGRDLQLINPVHAFNQDSNGFIIEMPKLNSGSQPSATGKLTFGINTQPNNSLDSEISNIPVNESISFPVKVNDLTLAAYLDIGTNSYAFPAKSFDIPLCFVNLGSDFLCPFNPKTFQLMSTGAESASFQVTIESAGSRLNRKNLAYDSISTDRAPNFRNAIFLGMPFFYGRKIYFGFDVPNSPMGLGKRVGFRSTE